MNIPKAIEILKTDLLRPGSVDKLDFQDAEQLGIKALKYQLELEQTDPEITLESLPGETED